MIVRRKSPEAEARQLSDDPHLWISVYLWVEKIAGSFDVNDPEAMHVPPARGVSIDARTGEMVVATNRGLQPAKVGDWVLLDQIEGFSVITRASFEAEYEAASGASVGLGGPLPGGTDFGAGVTREAR